VVSEKVHVCVKNEVQCKKRIVLSKVKNLVEGTSDRFDRIYSDITSKIEDNVLSSLTSYKNIRDNSIRLRNKRDDFNIAPNLDIPLQLQMTNNNYKFMQFDSGFDDTSRFIVFFSDEFKKYIQN
jgi:hypothetical protein